MKDKDELFRLIEKYKQNRCSDLEKLKLEKWFHELAANELSDIRAEKLQQVASDMWHTVNPRIHSKFIFFTKNKYKLVAAVVLFCLVSAIFWRIKSNPPTQIETAALSFGPAGNKAILKISNGNSLNLRGDRSSVISSGGSIKYEDGSEIINETLPDNTILELETPRGGWYTSVLPDGTKVWINAASSLKYPKQFSGTQRNVELQGEAYFEVAKDNKRPFHIQFNQGGVTVTGTKFNVKTYKDELEKEVSLLEGGVRVENLHETKLISPGIQASFTGQSKILVQPIDLNNVLAWKNGSFAFDDQNIYQIMNQVSRWYDIDVEFVGTISKSTYGGYYTRSKGLNDLLHYLETFGDFNFKIVERRVIVTAK
ncbi:MAG: FecR domain-containing protein [Sphingobacterium sp.]|jgi:hypothetical protein|nr:FecR domain-containing protein [Sphingobacterium sp.]